MCESAPHFRSATGEDARRSIVEQNVALPVDLDRELDLRSGAKRSQVDAAMKGHVIAQGELVGRYAVKPTWRDGHDTGLFTFRTLRALADKDSLLT